MAYRSKTGRRPDEHAGRASHQFIINDPEVQQFLSNCSMPAPPGDLNTAGLEMIEAPQLRENPIRHIITIDGGYTEVVVRENYPSTLMAFFQFGALFFSVQDLEDLAQSPFIFPEQISKLKNIQRFKLALPTKGIVLKDCKTLTESVRRAVYGFFVANTAEKPLLDTLRWFLFEEYAHTPAESWNLASCPNCSERDVEIRRDKLAVDYTVQCPHCGGRIWLTDVFRLHEAVDDEIGAGGILGYVTTLLEQMILVHLIRMVLNTKASLLREILFVKDGPLAFFGQTANMHGPMRRLARHLFTNHDLFLVGSEKSGAFVDHADALARQLPNGTGMILDNEYIHRYIIPGKADPDRPYGITTYYGSKVIYKTPEGSMYVLTLPTEQHEAAPKKTSFRNLDVVLHNVARLRCDMYDNALVPVALVNKLVSLSDHPSAAILQKFAQQGLAR